MTDVKIGESGLDPEATRVEPTDVVAVGNVSEFGGTPSRNIPASAIRRSNANHDIESINNSVRQVVGGIVGTELKQNGDFDIDTDGFFYDKSLRRTGVDTNSPQSGFSYKNKKIIDNFNRAWTGTADQDIAELTGFLVGVAGCAMIKIISVRFTAGAGTFSSTYECLVDRTSGNAWTVTELNDGGNGDIEVTATGTTITITLTGHPTLTNTTFNTLDISALSGAGTAVETNITYTKL